MREDRREGKRTLEDGRGIDLNLLLSAKTSSLSYAYMHGHVSFEK